MDRKRFDKLVALYSQIQYLNANREREDRAAATLSALSLPQELTPDTRTRMLQALYEVDASRFMFSFPGAEAFAEAMKDLGWNDKTAIDRWIAEDRAANAKAQWRPCIHDYKNPFAG